MLSKLKYFLLFLPLLSLAQGQDTLKREFSFYREKSQFLFQDSIRFMAFADSLKRWRYTSITLEGNPDEYSGDNKSYALCMKRAIAAYGILQSKGITRNIGAKSLSSRGRGNNYTRSVLLTIVVPKARIDRASFQVGKTIPLKTVQFYPGKDQLLPGADPTIKELSDFLKVRPKMEIEIDGHVCCNDDSLLSEKRAYTVYKKLVDQGVSAKRLSYKGMGTRYKIADEKTEAGKMTNRRVEVKVLKEE